MPATYGIIRLYKTVKNIFLDVIRYTIPGILYLNLQHTSCFTYRLRDFKNHLARPGKFHCIPEQIDNYLANSLFITPDSRRYAGTDINQYSDIFLVCL